jgi:hypothetical protein
MTVTPSAASRSAMSCDWVDARRFTRVFTAAMSTDTGAPSVDPANRTPSSSDSCTVVINSAVATSVFEGTQSVSTAEPPRPSRSTTVTSAPS